MSELTGKPYRGLTTFHQWNPGTPPSLENAQVHLEAAVRAPIVAKAQIPRTKERQHGVVAMRARGRHTQEEQAEGGSG